MKSFVLAALFCAALVVAAPSEDRDRTKELVLKLVHHREFQHHRASIQLGNQLQLIRGSALSRTAKPDEVACVNKATQKAVDEGQDLIAATIDAVLPQLDEMANIVKTYSSSPEQWQKAQEFAQANGYETYKKTCMRTFDNALIGWLEEKEMVVVRCLAPLG